MKIEYYRNEYFKKPYAIIYPFDNLERGNCRIHVSAGTDSVSVNIQDIYSAGEFNIITSSELIDAFNIVKQVYDQLVNHANELDYYNPIYVSYYRNAK